MPIICLKFGHLLHNLLLVLTILCYCCSMSTTFFCSFTLPNISQLELMDPSVVVLVIIYEEVGAFLYDGTWNQIGSYA